MFRLISALCVFIAINASTVAVAMTETELSSNKTHGKEYRKARRLDYKIMCSPQVETIINKLIQNQPVGMINLELFSEVSNCAQHISIVAGEFDEALKKIPIKSTDRVTNVIARLIKGAPINNVDGFDLAFFFDVRDYARENKIFDTDQELYNALKKIPLNCQRGDNIIKKILNDEPIESDFKRIPKHRTKIASVIKKVIRGEYIDAIEEDFLFYMKKHLRKKWIFDVGTLNAIMEEIPINVTPFFM